MKFVMLVILLGLCLAHAEEPLTFKLAETKQKYYCPPPAALSELKLLDIKLATSKDFLAVNALEVHEDFTNTKLFKVKEGKETTFGKDAGHPVVFDYTAIDLTFTKEGAEKFSKIWEKNFGKHVVLLINNKAIHAVCINSTGRPFESSRILRISLGTDSSKEESEKLFKLIKESIPKR